MSFLSVQENSMIQVDEEAVGHALLQWAIMLNIGLQPLVCLCALLTECGHPRYPV